MVFGKATPWKARSKSVWNWQDGPVLTAETLAARRAEEDRRRALDPRHQAFLALVQYEEELYGWHHEMTCGGPIEELVAKLLRERMAKAQQRFQASLDKTYGPQEK